MRRGYWRDSGKTRERHGSSGRARGGRNEGGAGVKEGASVEGCGQRRASGRYASATADALPKPVSRCPGRGPGPPRQKFYENKQYKKGIKTADLILKKFPDHGGAVPNVQWRLGIRARVRSGCFWALPGRFPDPIMSSGPWPGLFPCARAGVSPPLC